MVSYLTNLVFGSTASANPSEVGANKPKATSINGHNNGSARQNDPQQPSSGSGYSDVNRQNRLRSQNTLSGFSSSNSETFSKQQPPLNDDRNSSVSQPPRFTYSNNGGGGRGGEGGERMRGTSVSGGNSGRRKLAPVGNCGGRIASMDRWERRGLK